MIVSLDNVIAFPGISNSACFPPTSVLLSITYALGGCVISSSTKYPPANFTLAPAPTTPLLTFGVSPVLGSAAKTAAPNPAATTVNTPEN